MLDRLLNAEDIICYGYGEAFQIINKNLDLNIKYIIDKDITKWGLSKEGIVITDLENISILNVKDFLFFILPFNNNEIINNLKNLGVKQDNIITLQEILDKDKTFAELYRKETRNSVNRLKIIKGDLRKKRAEQLNYKNIKSSKEVYSKWFEIPPIMYRNINLIELLAADISILLDFVYHPEFEIDLYWHPFEEEYSIYGDGEILFPMFVRGREDYYMKMNKISSGLSNKIRIITYTDVNIKNITNLNKKNIKFKFEYSSHQKFYAKEIIGYFEDIYFQLSNYEKRWLEFSTEFYVSMIDFYLDRLNLNFKLLVSILPYYGEENILSQIAKLNNNKIITYQHGDYPSETTINRIHNYILFFSFDLDYYLVWDEESKNRLINFAGKEKKKIIVLGSFNEYFYDESKLGDKKKFLVACPGKVKDDEEIILGLLKDAEYIARKFNIQFDLRYHPLNIKNQEKSVFFDCLVSTENFSINDYDFAIGNQTTLIKELRNAGLPVFEKSSTCKMNYYKDPSELLGNIEKVYNKEIIIKKDIESEEVIKEKYRIFINNLL